MAAALRLPTPSVGGGGGHLRSFTFAYSAFSSSFVLKKSITTGRSIVIRATMSSKKMQQQQQQNTTTNPDTTTTFPSPSSPLRAADDIASRLGFEMAVAILERLFSSSSSPSFFPATTPGGGGAHPPDAGPSGRPVRVAYQGVRGSYCQEAAAEAFSSFLPTRLESFPCVHMEDAFAALEDGAADRAVVPVENSLDGPIHRNFDLLLRHPAVEIVGEVVLPVNHCLLSLPGASVAGIRRVVSHPQALDHCRGRLAALGRSLEVDEVPNAADAARFLSEDRIGIDTAVIGSKIAAREFGLEVLEENFQDPAAGGNYTRFLQLGLRRSPDSLPSSSGSGGEVHHSGERGVRRKTTVAFSLDKGVSDLFRAMWIFESRGAEVTRVDHRPNRSSPVRVVDKDGERAGYFDYVFILDLEESDSDGESSSIAAAVDRLTEICGFVRVLGTYQTCGTSRR